MKEMMMNQAPLDIAERAIKQHSTDVDYKLVLIENNEDNITIRDGATEKLQHATSTSLVIHLFIQGREGFYFTSHLEEQALKSFVRQAIDTTSMLEPDDSRQLADPSRYYKGGGVDLKNCDASIREISPEEKIHLAKTNNLEVAGTDSRIIGLQTKYSDRVHLAYHRISNGFENHESSSRCTLTTIITVEGENGQRPMDGWGETRIFYRDLPTQGIAETALKRTLNKIGQRPTASGNYRMILESTCVETLLQPILSAMKGEALQQQTSFLTKHLDQPTLSPLITLVDDPLIPGTRGASHFDYDGVATRRLTLFDQGVLKTYFIDTAYGRKLNMAPTTLGAHHLIMEPGNQTLQELIASSERAILVTDFNGGNCDHTTGNYSYGIEGYLIQSGIITQPISGMNITGNILDTWNRVSALGNDFDPWELDLLPSMVFEDIPFGGI